MTSIQYTMTQKATEYINGVLPGTIPRPRVGIICGSGLGGLVSTFHPDPQISIPYADIPNFPVGTVRGHESRLVFGTLGEKKTGIVAMVGRLHFYEGYDMATVTLPIRVFHLLGVETIISTPHFVFLT
jgi:purine-nucleoside phosphorylase